jgi:hypothetical protein
MPGPERSSGCSTPFHAAGEFGADTWGNNSNVYTGNAGAWAPFPWTKNLVIYTCRSKQQQEINTADSATETICFRRRW